MNTTWISVASTLWLAVCCSAMSAAERAVTQENRSPMVKMDDAKYGDWLARWEKNITGDARNRYCDKAMGEDIGWLMTPFMDGTYKIWNYWQPAGPWDYKPDGSPKHWVGVHPNPGYYQIDVAAIVDAFEHGLVFSRKDIEHLVATALTEKRYWDALVPYNAAIQKEFEAAMKPDSWGGLSAAARYLMLQSQLRQNGRVVPEDIHGEPHIYYVEQGNSLATDANPGTAAQPWKTIQKAANTVGAGDSVIVKAGIYAEQIGIFSPHAGTADRPITFRANPGDKVVIDGGRKNSFGFRLGASFIRIDGFQIINVVGHGILVGWSDRSSQGVQIVNNTIHDCGNHSDTAAIYYAGGSDGLIEGNHLFKNAGDGITFPNIAGGITIKNNHIHDNDVDGMKGGGDGLILIDGNTIHDMTSALHHGDGMQLMGMIGTLLVRNNTVWDCTQDIYCDDYSEHAGTRPWGDVYIYNNVVCNSSPGPEGIGGFWNGIVTGTRYNSWRSVTVCGNTLVNCNDGSGGVSVAVVGPTAGKIGTVRVLNNLFFNSTNNVAVGSLASRGSQIEMDFNGYYNQWRDWYLGDGWRDLTKFRAAHPECEQHGFYSTDFRFARDAIPEPDYHLVADSAAIGKGTSIPPVAAIRFDEDKDGNLRPQETAWDIGAYQFVAEPVVTQPTQP